MTSRLIYERGDILLDYNGQIIKVGDGCWFDVRTGFSRLNSIL